MQVFVEYASAEECKKAYTALSGRKFAQRVVVTSYFNPDLYRRGQFAAVGVSATNDEESSDSEDSSKSSSEESDEEEMK